MTTMRRWWVFALVCLALFMGALDSLVVTTALPAIGRALHARLSDLEWTVNAYTLVFTICMIPAAAVGDRFGHRRVLLGGVALFTLGSALAALAGSSLLLALSRALQGLGAACITPLTLTILMRTFPESQQGLVIGLWSGIAGLGLTVGPLVGGAVVSGWNWNAVFWMNVPLGILLLVLGRLYLPASRGEQRSLDLPGGVLIGASLLAIVVGISSGNTAGWGSVRVLGALVVGVLLLVAFLRREQRVAAPMIELKLFTVRTFRVADSTGFLMNLGTMGSIFFLTQFMQNVLKASPLQAGLETMPWTGTIMLIAPLTGWLTKRLGRRAVVLAGMLAQAAALVWIGALAATTVPYVSLLPAYVLAGAGMGLSLAPVTDAAMSAIAGPQQGQASGVLNTLRQLGGVFGVAILGAAFGLVAPIEGQFLDGFRVAIFVGAGILTIGGFLALLLPGRQVPPQVTEPTLADTSAIPVA